RRVADLHEEHVDLRVVQDVHQPARQYLEDRLVQYSVTMRRAGLATSTSTSYLVIPSRRCHSSRRCSACLVQTTSTGAQPYTAQARADQPGDWLGVSSFHTVPVAL